MESGALYMNFSKLFCIFLLSFNIQAAVHISHNGKAEAMIVPYYTVANGLTTLLTIDNTTDEFKAIKLHLREARKGDAIYSFNLYLTPKDMWAAAITDVNGVVNILSNDESCTINLHNLIGPPPQTPEGGWEWQTGLLEIIEMGVIDTTQIPDMNNENRCQVMNDAWEAQGPNSLWRADGTNAMLPVTGGLQANTTVIDVSSGFSFDVPVIHLDDFYPENTIDNQPPESEFPDLSSGDTVSLLIHNGQAITTQWPTGYEAVSALLMKTTLENEFDVETATAGATEWVISFPTARYHLSSPISHKPFYYNNGMFTFPGSNGSGWSVISREAEFRTFYCMYKCTPPTPLNTISHHVNTFIFNSHGQQNSLISGEERENVLKLNNHTDLDDFTHGKVEMYLLNGFYSEINDRGTDTVTSNQHIYHGLPFVGFAFQKYQNAHAQPGLLATYATAKPHTGNILIETESNNQHLSSR